MICSSLKRLLRTTPPLGPERAILNGEVTFPLDYFSGAGHYDERDLLECRSKNAAATFIPEWL